MVFATSVYLIPASSEKLVALVLAATVKGPDVALVHCCERLVVVLTDCRPRAQNGVVRDVALASCGVLLKQAL